MTKYWHYWQTSWRRKIKRTDRRQVGSTLTFSWKGKQQEEVSPQVYFMKTDSGKWSGPETEACFLGSGPEKYSPRCCHLVNCIKKDCTSGTHIHMERSSRRHEKKKTQYEDLAYLCWARRYTIWIFLAEIRDRGYPAQSVWTVLGAQGMKERTRKYDVRGLIKAAE